MCLNFVPFGTDHDFGRPSGTGVFLYRYPGTSYLATITLSLRDKIHSSAEALLKLTLMERNPTPTRLRGGLDASSCHRFPKRVNNLIHDCVERFARVNDDRVLRFLERGKLAFHQFLWEKMG